MAHVHACAACAPLKKASCGNVGHVAQLCSNLTCMGFAGLADSLAHQITFWPKPWGAFLKLARAQGAPKAA